MYCHDDVNVVVSFHQQFFQKVGPHTKRLNPVSLGNMAKELFKMSSREAPLFGTSLAHAYSHRMLAGGKIKTEEKLAYSVWAVWQANGGHAETASSSADPSLNKENSFFYPGQASQDCEEVFELTISDHGII